MATVHLNSNRSQFTIRNLFELTTITAAMFAFSNVIGSASAAALASMAGFTTLRRGGLALACLCAGALLIRDEFELGASILAYILLAAAVAFWPMVMHRLHTSCAVDVATDDQH